MTSPDPCRWCGGPLDVVLCESGPHYGQLVCTACGRHATWLKKPDPPAPPGNPPPPELLALCPDRAEPAELRGTAPQVYYAANLRARTLARARKLGLAGHARVLASVADATWFLANRDRTLAQLRWPSPAQLAPAAGEPRGKIPR